MHLKLSAQLKSFQFSCLNKGPIVEKWSLEALESSLELEIMEPFNFNSLTVVLLVWWEVKSLIVCHVF